MSKKQNPKINVSPTTKNELDSSKLVDCETYDSVITRLIEISRKRS